MSKKRDRRRGRPPTVSRPPATAVEPEPAPEQEPTRRPRGLLRDPGHSPFPPFSVTLAAAARAVGGSPLVLATVLLSTLLLWGFFVVLGTAPPAHGMVVLTALPPVTISLDVGLVNVATDQAIPSTAMILGAAAMRAAVIGFISLLLVARLRDEPVRLAATLRALPRTAGILFLVLSVEFALVIVVPLLLQALGGPALYQIGGLAAIILGLHYFSFALAIPAAEGATPADALRMSIRAARIPGPRHLLVVVAYFSFVFWTASITPGGPAAPVTPSPVLWGFSLVASLGHAIALAGFTLRWLAVRDRVPRPERRARR